MEKKLQANDHKTHWSEMTLFQLGCRLEDENRELKEALQDFTWGDQKDTTALRGEAVDVANFAMMIFDNATDENKTLCADLQATAGGEGG